MGFGGWAISQELFDWLDANVKHGSTILELGSGKGTAELVKLWEVYSVEHDLEWVGKVKGSHYLHAPLVDGWYHPNKVNSLIKQIDCDVVIIDGPPSAQGRGNFIRHMGLFNPAVPWVFDDMHRLPDLRSAAKVAKARDAQLVLHQCADGKEFGVIAADHRLPT